VGTLTPESEKVIKTINDLPSNVDYRAWWFLILGVLLLRSDLKVTITKEEWEKAQSMQISSSVVDGNLVYTGTLPRGEEKDESGGHE
jgi:hypothetical protein